MKSIMIGHTSKLWMVLMTTVCGLSLTRAGRNFFDDFSGDFAWSTSQDERYAGSKAVVDGEGSVVDGEANLRLAATHRHYGLTWMLDDAVDPGHESGFVLQYEVNLPKDITCSGGYLKLLVHDKQFMGENLVESTPYSIMFGPDMCGSMTSKTHLIFRSENPISGEFEEKHMTASVTPVADGMTHLYTLRLNSKDNSFAIDVDGEEKAKGLLTENLDFSPPFAAPKEIDDPEDVKPDDWVDDETIPDPEDVKPDDWDSIPEKIPEPDAIKPAEWNDEDDGEWEPPLIANPEYKGKWIQKRISNPDYVGPWKPRKIANPNYFEESNPLSKLPSIGAVAIEVLANDEGIRFDSVMIGNDLKEANSYFENVFKPKMKKQNEILEQELEKLKAEAREAKKQESGVVSWLLNTQDSVTSFLDSTLGKGYFGICVGLGLSIFGFILIIITRRQKAAKARAEAAQKKDDPPIASNSKETESDTKEEDNEQEESDDDDTKEKSEGLRRRSARQAAKSD